jgi:hypothetical protein
VGVIAEQYQRMLAALLPPSRLWRLVGDSVIRKLLLGSADELERLHGRYLDLLDESIPSDVDELLEEYERELELEAEGTDAERRARVVARYIARQRYRPVDFQLALAPLLGMAAADVVVLETSHAVAVAMGDHREIFRFFIFRDPTEPGTYDVDGAQALIDDIKPSHTQGHVIESIDFLCDDPYSLCDRDLLGA